MTLTKKKFDSRHLLFLSLVWVLVQAFLIWKYGIVTDFEAKKYTFQADYLLENGHYSTGNFLFYSTEILLIAASKKIGAGYWPVIGVQLLFNAFSVYCFYGLIEKLTGKAKIAFWYAVCFLGMYYYHIYNVYLFTESIYFSLSIIFFYFLITIEKIHFLNVVGLIVGITILYLTRPVGIFFIPATFLYIVFKFFPKKSWLIISISGTVFSFVFIFLLNNSLNSGGELDFLLPYLDERIICGVPTTGKPHQLNVPVEQDSVQGLFYIITHYWQLFIRLAAKRLLAFVGVLRSYYSLAHNIFIGLYFYTIYVFIILGIKNWDKTNKPHIAFLLAMFLLTAITTALSCDEWHNRFILAILPFLLLLSTYYFTNGKSKRINDHPKVK